MVLPEVLDSPNLSEADKLVYALNIGNGDLTKGEIAGNILDAMIGEEPEDAKYLKDEDLQYLAEVVNS